MYEVFEILTNEFQKTEELLRDNSYDILLKIADINVQLDMVNRYAQYQLSTSQVKFISNKFFKLIIRSKKEHPSTRNALE